MEEKDVSSNVFLYTEGVGPSRRVYRGIERYENGWIRLLGFDRDTWVVPATDLGALEEFDTPEFTPNPEIYESTGRPKNWSEIREAVLQREHYLCQNCADTLPEGEPFNPVVHPAVLPEHGGRLVVSNLLVHCRGCHRGFLRG